MMTLDAHEVLQTLDTLCVEHGHIRAHAKYCDRCCAAPELRGLIHETARREARERIANGQPDRLWLWINGLVRTLEPEC